MKTLSSDFDNSWKEILEYLFESFIEFFFPRIYPKIDWKKKVEFLDHEFRQLMEEANIEKSLADKLVKVWLKEGEELWVLIHIEIQNQKVKNFEQRMYDYHTSIYKRYGHRIASLAILGDRNKSWKPTCFDYNNLDSGIIFYYPIAKLTDYLERWHELENSRNPFAVAVMAHLIMLKSGKDVTNLAFWKMEITKELLKRGFSPEITSYVLRFIDIIINLPKEMEIQYRQQVMGYVKEMKMVNTMIPWEKVAFEDGMEKGLVQGMEKGLAKGMEKGLAQGLERMKKGLIQKSQEAVIVVLETRFDTIPRTCLASIKKISNASVLDSLLKTAIKVNSLKEFKEVLKETKQYT